MEEIKVGDYVRTNFGIAKLIKKEPAKNYPDQIIYTFDNINEELWSGDLPNEMWQSEIDFETEKFGNPFLKHSPNIIDLIEVGDYVNGYFINYIPDNEKAVYHDASDCADVVGFRENDIKSIVTKEQFENIKYEV